ncbi:MAG: hypothetical protein AAF229_04620 [Pseudomonadota bacterium]
MTPGQGKWLATLTVLAALVSAAVAVLEFMREPTPPTTGSYDADPETEDDQPYVPPEPEVPACPGNFKWQAKTSRCERKESIAAKTFSIRLSERVSSVAGRIDFYLNQERRPGADAQGYAMYTNRRGAVQVVIPVMLGNREVGNGFRTVIFSAPDGGICSIDRLPETTGHLQRMRVAYSVQLADCAGSNTSCSARLDQNQPYLNVTTRALVATIAPTC